MTQRVELLQRDISRTLGAIKWSPREIIKLSRALPELPDFVLIEELSNSELYTFTIDWIEYERRLRGYLLLITNMINEKVFEAQKRKARFNAEIKVGGYNEPDC